MATQKGLILFVMLYVTYGFQSIPIPNGIQVVPHEDIYFVNTEWEVVIAITPPTIDMQLSRHLETLQHFITNMQNVSDFRNSWNIRLVILKDRLHKLSSMTNDIRTALRMRRRERRSLFDLGGKLLSSVFGVVTQQQFDDYKVLLEITRNNQDALAHHQNKMISILNHTRIQAIHNADQIRTIVRTMREIQSNFQTVQDNEQNIKVAIDTNHHIMKINGIISKFEAIVGAYSDQFDLFNRRHTFIELSKLTHELLPVTQLQEILQRGENRHNRVIRPFQWYYEDCHIQPLWKDFELIYRVKLPLTHPQPWYHVSLQVWPVPANQSGWFTQLDVHSGTYAINLRTTEFTIPQDIRGHNPTVARLGVITKQEDCVIQLINQKGTKGCRVKIFYQGRYIVKRITDNRYIVSTHGTSINERCDNGSMTSGKLLKKVYLIDLDMNCYVSMDILSFWPLNTRRTQQKLGPLNTPFNFDLNLDQVNIPSVILNKMKQNLLSNGTGVQVPLGDLNIQPIVLSTLPPYSRARIQKATGASVSIVTIGITIVIVIIVFRRWKSKHGKPLTQVIEMAQVTATAPKAEQVSVEENNAFVHENEIKDNKEPVIAPVYPDLEKFKDKTFNFTLK